jgi:hypothetical protein
MRFLSCCFARPAGDDGSLYLDRAEELRLHEAMDLLELLSASSAQTANEPFPCSVALRVKLIVVRAGLKHNITKDPDQFTECARQLEPEMLPRDLRRVGLWIDDVFRQCAGTDPITLLCPVAQFDAYAMDRERRKRDAHAAGELLTRSPPPQPQGSSATSYSVEDAGSSQRTVAASVTTAVTICALENTSGRHVAIAAFTHLATEYSAKHLGPSTGRSSTVGTRAESGGAGNSISPGSSGGAYHNDRNSLTVRGGGRGGDSAKLRATRYPEAAGLHAGAAAATRQSAGLLQLSGRARRPSVAKRRPGSFLTPRAVASDSAESLGGGDVDLGLSDGSPSRVSSPTGPAPRSARSARTPPTAATAPLLARSHQQLSVGCRRRDSAAAAGPLAALQGQQMAPPSHARQVLINRHHPPGRRAAAHGAHRGGRSDDPPPTRGVYQHHHHHGTPSGGSPHGDSLRLDPTSAGAAGSCGSSAYSDRSAAVEDESAPFAASGGAAGGVDSMLEHGQTSRPKPRRPSSSSSP